MANKFGFLAAVLTFCALLLSSPNQGAFAADTCKNGQAPVDGECLQKCSDGSEIPETETCQATPPSGQTCKNGEPPVDGQCLQTCSDGKQIPETETCPGAAPPPDPAPPADPAPPPGPGAVCKNGQPAPAEGCVQTCSDGSQIPETETCPTEPPAPTQFCKDGRPVPANSVCMQTCRDGTRIPETQSCSEGVEDSGFCRDGRPVPRDGLCRKRCPDGSEVPENQSCGSCPGGQVGTPPNCRCPSDLVWNPRAQRCVPPTAAPPSCQEGMVRTPQGDCRCAEGTSWNPNLRRCIPARGGIYGAIAYSRQTHATGYAVNMPSLPAAIERALQECGPRCEIVQRFRAACAALAVGRRGWGTAAAPDRREAGFIAMENCSRYSPACEVKVSVCSGR